VEVNEKTYLNMCILLESFSRHCRTCWYDYCANDLF